MSRRDRDFRTTKQPKPTRDPNPWVAPTFAEREAAKKASTVEPQALTVDQELNVATMDRSLPNVDFHGKTRDDVQWEIDQLFSENPGRCVRIIYGRGQGIMERAVLGYLHQLQRRKNSPILGSRGDAVTHSVVVRVK